MKFTDLSLTSLIYFIDAIELGSLTAAAEKNSISRPAISQSIKRLEDLIGYDLISHKKNSLVLTSRGRAFLKTASIAIDRFKETFEDLSGFENNLNIACSNTLAEFLILPKIKEINSASGMRMQLGTTSKVRNLVLEDAARVGFIIDDGQTYGLRTVKIKTGNFLIYSKTGNVDDLFITTEIRPEVTALRKEIKRRGMNSQFLQIESWTACRKASELLGGSCLIPDLLASPQLKLVRRFNFHFSYSILAIYKDHNLLSESELALLEALQK